jgi:hypothetical protein
MQNSMNSATSILRLPDSFLAIHHWLWPIRSASWRPQPNYLLFGLSWNEFGDWDCRRRCRDDGGQHEKLTKFGGRLSWSVLMWLGGGRKRQMGKMIFQISLIGATASQEKRWSKLQNSIYPQNCRRRSPAEVYMGNPSLRGVTRLPGAGVRNRVRNRVWPGSKHRYPTQNG